VTRSRNRCDHASALRLDLLNPVFADLIEVLAVERGARMRGDVYRADQLAGGRVERMELVSGREPDVSTVERHAVHALYAGERSVLANDLRRAFRHDGILVAG